MLICTSSMFQLCKLLQGLWRGTLPGQLLTIPYTAVQFVTLQQVRHHAQQTGLTGAMGDRTLSFVSGAAAGAAASIASYPFDILRTTLAAQGEPKVVMWCMYMCLPRWTLDFLQASSACLPFPFTCNTTACARFEPGASMHAEFVALYRRCLVMYMLTVHTSSDFTAVNTALQYSTLA